jgi:AcrR family transcriptional regulator
MFSSKGFYNTTIAEVAKNIGMSVGNIYNYFPSKSSLAKASIVFVTKKLARILRDINNQSISSKEKVEIFVDTYLLFIQEHPEMIDYFFRVYLANREMFCDEEDCGFKLAKDFVDEIERLINDGVKSGEFAKQNFYIAFSTLTGILGGITFLNGEKVLDAELRTYGKDLSRTIYKALS